MPPVGLWVPPAVIAVATIAIGLFAEWGGALVFLFLSLVAWVLALGVGLGGDWTREASRGRFKQPEERNR